MAEYKVVFRDENPEWQEKCPVLIEAVQVSRDVQSSAAFLQLRVGNIADKTIGSVFVEAKVVSPDGEAETVSVESLDADIAPNAEYRPSAVQLSNPEIATVKVYVTRIDDRRDFGKVISAPTPQPIAMSQDALDERRRQLVEMGLANAPLGYRHQDGNGWWMCACGALNISNQKCRMCGIKKGSLTNLENEALLEEQCAERKYLDASARLVSNNVTAVEKARTTFASLGDYKDSVDLICQCDDKIKALKKGGSKKIPPCSVEDTQELCNALYALSASSLGFESKPIRKYSNVTFKYEITGCMPGGLDDRTVSVYDSIHNESKQKQLKYGGGGSLLMSQLIDGGGHSATITITDDATGSVLLDETISF